MKIVMTGGGSGGHITPLVAVAHEIKQRGEQTAVSIVYIAQQGDDFGAIVRDQPVIDETYSIRAGKFRRYHGKGLEHLLDYKSTWLNIRDMFYTFAGWLQSVRLLWKLKPDVVFCKGGYVGVPVGLAAAFLRIPYVTHDSDAIPGLANRIIARWAAWHAVAFDKNLYPYPAATTTNVGVPIAPQYRPVTAAVRAAYRRQIGLEQYGQVLVVTGGGLGAARLNDAMLANAEALLAHYSGLCIVHATGTQHEAPVSEAYTKALTAADRSRVVVRGFLHDLYKYTGAADVVVARGGATNFAELALQAKPCVIVPNPLLTGGHQLKNALAYAEKGAVMVVAETELHESPTALGRAVRKLLDDSKLQRDLALSIHSFARPRAAAELAAIIIRLGQHKQIKERGGREVAKQTEES